MLALCLCACVLLLHNARQVAFQNENALGHCQKLYAFLLQSFMKRMAERKEDFLFFHGLCVLSISSHDDDSENSSVLVEMKEEDASLNNDCIMYGLFQKSHEKVVVR